MVGRSMVSVAVAVGVLLTGAGVCAAVERGTEPAAPAIGQHPDFDGDGFADVAVGVPLEDVAGVVDAGAVSVLYGSASGIIAAGNQIFDQGAAGILDAPESGDRFGSALAWADFDGDGFDDLAVSVASEDVAGVVDAGAVAILYGSPAGLSSSGNQLWHQNTAGILDAAETSDQFGLRLATGDFDGDGFDDLAITVLGEDVAGVTDAGAVNVIYGSSAGLASTGNQFWNQDSAGILDAAEAGDDFGSSIATGDFNGDGFDDLAAEVFLENVGAVADAGAIAVLYGSASGITATGNQFWSQNTAGILDAAERRDQFGFPPAAGDFDGDGFDDLAVGVLGEDVEGVVDAGAMAVLYGSRTGLTASGNQLWSQNSSGVEDAAETGDVFGRPRTGDFDGDGFADVAVGVILEDVGAIADAGAVNVLYGTSAGLTSVGDQFWHQNVAGIEDAAETGDRFGSDRSAGDFDGDGFDDLAVGAALEDLGADTDAGAVNVIYGTAAGLSATGDQLWDQDTAGVLDSAEPNDQFGFATSVGPAE